MKKPLILAGVVVVVALAAVLVFSPKTQFVAGGALVNLGFRMQDHLHEFDLDHGEHLKPDEVFKHLMEQNALAASVRSRFPRTPHHPLVAMVVCMDARIDTEELVGDTRKYYYVIRTAGSALANKELEMLELAVANGVETILLTTHSDCAAEKVAKDPALRAKYPELVDAVDHRAEVDKALLARPAIAKKIADGSLAIKFLHIDTATEQLSELPGPR